MNWKFVFVLSSVLSVSSVSNVEAATHAHASKALGLGLSGSLFASGLSAKTFLSPTLAVQGVLGFNSFGGFWAPYNYYGYGYGYGYGWYGGGYAIAGDVLYEGQRLWGNSQLSLNWEAGGGVGVMAWARPFAPPLGAVFASGIIGLNLQLLPFPLELAIDVRPTLLFGLGGFVPFSPNGGVSVRYFF